MYKAAYIEKAAETNGNGLKRSKSLDNEVKIIESECQYLKDTLGDILGDVLSDCALLRPDDPVTFVADAFER